MNSLNLSKPSSSQESLYQRSLEQQFNRETWLTDQRQRQLTTELSELRDRPQISQNSRQLTSHLKSQSHSYMDDYKRYNAKLSLYNDPNGPIQ